jgi:biotin carboxyl carrier protein
LADNLTRVYWNGEPRDLELPESSVTEVEPGHFIVRTGDRVEEVFEANGRLSNGRTLDQVELVVESNRERVIRERFQSTGTTGAAKSGTHVVKAPMPGLVRTVSTRIDDAVERTTTLLVLEAMKMENNISAGVAGKVVRVLVEQGKSVDKNSPLVEIELT